MIPVREMETRHLVNVIKLLARTARNYNKRFIDMVADYFDSCDEGVEKEVCGAFYEHLQNKHWSNYLHPIWPEMVRQLEIRHHGSLPKEICDQIGGKDLYYLLNLKEPNDTD